MKVILLSTVPKVGKEGTIIDVANGYARNYLFPRKLAIVAEKNQVKALEIRLARIAAKTAGEKANMIKLAESLNGKTVRIAGQVGAVQGKLFGAITSQNIVDAIKAQLGTTIEKKQVALIDAIKRLGTFSIELDLHREVDAHISVEVYDPNAPVIVAPAPAEETNDEENDY